MRKTGLRPIAYKYWALEAQIAILLLKECNMTTASCTHIWAY